jgi:kynurenine formamidase
VPAVSATVEQILSALSAGSVRVIDLTQPLSEDTPIIRLPPQLPQMPHMKVHVGASYGAQPTEDPATQPDAWNWMTLGEHTGTHFDAPIHWYTGRHGLDVASVPLTQLVGPAVVLDVTTKVATDPDYLLTIEDVREFERRTGPLPEGGWLLVRTGWGSRAHDEELFLNHQRWPGVTSECAEWLANQTALIGVGTETVSTDAGCSPSLEPMAPAHYYLHGAGKHGLTQLANLELLPERNVLLVVAPLRLVGGTGSPARVVALVDA